MSRISEQRRADILSAALNEFMQRGLDGASMSEIAARAGIGKSTIYEYFPSKAVLFVAACKAEIRRVDQTIREIFSEDRPFSELLEAYLCLMLDLAQGVDYNEIMRMFSNASVDELICAMEEMSEDVADVTKKAIQRAQVRGELASDLDATITAVYLLGLPNPHTILRMRRLDRENPVKAIVDMALRGLKPGEGETKSKE